MCFKFECMWKDVFQSRKSGEVYQHKCERLRLTYGDMDLVLFGNGIRIFIHGHVQKQD